MDARGFTLIEVIVALLILSVTAVGLAETLMAAQRIQRTSGRWMEAVMLAERTLEQSRLGGTGGNDSVGSFRRSWGRTPFDAELGLTRVDVVIEWGDPRPGRLHLTTLVRQ